MQYNKKVLTTKEQIDFLKKKNLIISDLSTSEEFLRRTYYFKFNAYLKEFRTDKHDGNFLEGSEISQAIELYYFDSKLRTVLFDALEEIEIAIKAKLIDSITPKYGNNWHEDSTLFVDNEDFKFEEYLEKLKKKLIKPKGQEKYIKHYYAKYTNPEHPPIWMIMETITLGTVSKLYTSFKDERLKADISWETIEMVDSVFTSWLHHFTYLRNLCAHHCLVWNRIMQIRAKFPTPRKFKIIAETESIVEEGKDRYAKVYASLCIINYFLNKINPSNNFHIQVLDLIKSHPQIDLEKMGFTPNWREEWIWNRWPSI